MEMAVEMKRSKWRKVAVGGAIGGVVGMLAALALMSLFDRGALGVIGQSGLLAALVGSIYALIAMFMGIGLLRPGLGARFLNVEDADELREQRRVMAYAAAGAGAMGLALIVLGLAGPGGIVPRATALAGSLALFAAGAVAGVAQWRHMDELMKRLSHESGNLAFYLLLTVGGGWAMLAHLGYAEPAAPLDWLTMLSGFVLLASFIVTGRRGMLAPR